MGQARLVVVNRRTMPSVAMEIGVHLTTVGYSEAEAICGLLRASGIACNDREATGAFTGMMASGIGGWREILVGEHDFEQARTLLESAQLQ